MIDASACIELLLQTPRAAAVTNAVAGVMMVAPDLLTLEVLSVLRRLEQNGTISTTRAAHALTDLLQAPIRRLPTLPLAVDVWALRANLTPYDACYVASARALGCTLITADARLARAPIVGVTIHIV